VLLLALEDPDKTVRSNAAKSLGQIGKQDIALLPDLVRAMNDESWGVRVNAAYAVYRTDRSKWDIVLPLLTEALNHEKDSIRSDAVRVLGDIKAPIQDVMPLLVNALNDEVRVVRRGAAKALGKIGDPAAVPVLREALQAEGWSMVQAVVVALTQIDAPEALETLISALSDTDYTVRYHVSDALEKMNPPPKDAVPALIAVLNDTDPWARRQAARALGKIGDPAAVPMLIENLTHGDPRVREAAVDALKKIATPEALKAVKKFDGR
jgi:HEAT repeat protein